MALEHFKIQVVRRHSRALDRRLDKAVMIGTARGDTMNRKEDYNRYLIPVILVTRKEEKRRSGDRRGGGRRRWRSYSSRKGNQRKRSRSRR